MCPCPQNDGGFALGLWVAVGVVFAVAILRSHWAGLNVIGRVLAVAAIPTVAGLVLAFGPRTSGDRVPPAVLPAAATSTAPADEPMPGGQPSYRSPSVQAAEVSNEERPLQIIAYYFHRTVRCPSCIQIEEWAKQSIESAFAPELSERLVQWRPVNIEEPGNEHFEKDFDLAGQSLVLVRMENGLRSDWVNLSAVWDLLGDRLGFERYVTTELRMMLDDETARGK